ncbi:MAG: hypothetical protein ACRCUY_11330 [Thermoguttaceae bacterium]
MDKKITCVVLIGILSVFCFDSANADLITFRFVPAESSTQERFDDLGVYPWDSMFLQAERRADNSGVSFTFWNDYGMGKSQKEFLVWDSEEVFSGGKVAQGYDGTVSNRVGNYPEYDLGTPDMIISGFSYVQFEDYKFDLFFDEGKGWDDFLTAANRVGDSLFAVALHLQALDEGNSAKIITGTFVKNINEIKVTPEPATFLIFSCAVLAGAVWLNRRRFGIVTIK